MGGTPRRRSRARHRDPRSLTEPFTVKTRSISIVRHPLDAVWTAIRDHLPELVRYLDDIESVTVQSREELPDGTVRLVNLWRAKPKLPAIVANRIRPDMLAWTDRAEYRPATRECHWNLEPHFFSEHFRCPGLTRYEPAMGGRGTRVTFENDLQISLQRVPGVPSLLEGTLASGIESFVSALIPKNLRKLTDAAAKFLDATTPTSPSPATSASGGATSTPGRKATGPRGRAG